VDRPSATGSRAPGQRNPSCSSTLGAGADDWVDTAIALSDRRRVIALDQRGHGASARPGFYSFELMRDDLARFIDNLGLLRPVLIGHSMGGTVAYLYAEAFPIRSASCDRRHTTAIFNRHRPGPSRTPSPTTCRSTVEFWRPSFGS